MTLGKVQKYTGKVRIMTGKLIHLTLALYDLYNNKQKNLGSKPKRTPKNI